jgi:hypothetical protein
MCTGYDGVHIFNFETDELRLDAIRQARADRIVTRSPTLPFVTSQSSLSSIGSIIEVVIEQVPLLERDDFRHQ